MNLLIGLFLFLFPIEVQIIGIKKTSYKPINYFDTLMYHIPKHEGLSLKKYSCSAGHTTIGYGHVITQKDNLPFVITKKQADSLLFRDILKAKKYLDANISNTLQSNLSPNQYWTLVHFIFCKGIGNFNKSRLKKELEGNFIEANVKEELLRWCYYKNPDTGKLIYSKWSESIRLNEISLWYNGYIVK
jgi:GH24 family phage-related lysozyme (muramidase)